MQGNGYGTDIYGFKALPNGFRRYNGYFYEIGFYGYWWTATESNTPYSWYRLLDFNSPKIKRDNQHNEYGFGVRCIKD